MSFIISHVSLLRSFRSHSCVDDVPRMHVISCHPLVPATPCLSGIVGHSITAAAVTFWCSSLAWFQTFSALMFEQRPFAARLTQLMLCKCRTLRKCYLQCHLLDNRHDIFTSNLMKYLVCQCSVLAPIAVRFVCCISYHNCWYLCNKTCLLDTKNDNLY